MQPGDSIEKLFTRLKPDQKKALAKLHIHTIRDLLYHFPSRYESSAPKTTIASSTDGEVTLYGTVRKPETRKAWKSRRPMAEAWLEDASGKLKMMWFSQPYIAKTLHDGMQVKVKGRISGAGTNRYLANPEIEHTAIDASEVHDSLFSKETTTLEKPYPVYPESRGISSLWFTHAIHRAFSEHVHEKIDDPLPDYLREKYNLPALSTALIFIHEPQKIADTEVARKRFAFEEIFSLQVLLQKERAKIEKENALPIKVDRGALKDFVASFSFPPTNAQTRAISAILDDFERGHPMLRLLEGDVGSGKTAVAAATSYLVVTSTPPDRKAGTLQVAYLCPTEVLARQQFSTFISFFKEHHVTIGLATGSECRRFPSKIRSEESAHLSKAAFKKAVANDEIAIVVGTHALVQKTLEFKHLAYAIIDEQHRFGIVHRKKLVSKSEIAPHLLSMTATPIPRTLALTIYGDLDISLLDEMPKGRKPVITKVLGKETRNEAYEKIREELRAGHQVYIICPRINEPDPAKELALQARSVKAEAARLAKSEFPNATIGILHSKMTATEKEKAMEQFEKNETQILVATSVVEVGVNVPNATVIMIEGAERFGLAQLHQLRGRVIRSTHQSYCFALPESYGPTTRERLKAFTTAKNGFELAEYDLALRGTGELASTRQWGVSDIAMEALKNIKLVELARDEAQKLIAQDPGLKKYPLLRERAQNAGSEIHME